MADEQEKVQPVEDEGLETQIAALEEEGDILREQLQDANARIEELEGAIDEWRDVLDTMQGQMVNTIK